MPRSGDVDVGGGARRAAPPRPLRGRRHVPILNRRCVAALVFRRVERIRATSVVGLHPEGGDGREQQFPPRPVGGALSLARSASGERERLRPIFFRRRQHRGRNYNG